MTGRRDGEPRTASLGSGPISYVLRRSPRSRGLRVVLDPHRGAVVSVPPASRRGWAHPEPLIEAFLRDREAWLRRHLERQARERASIAALGGVRDGADLRYLGERHRLRLEPAAPGQRRSSVERSGSEDRDELVVRLTARDRGRAASVLRAWLRARAAETIHRAIERHADALGVRPAGVTLRDPRSRWGSATRRRTLSFSWRLILAPPEALDGVVVHELAHLRVFGHGPDFWALVVARRPDHLVWRRWLRVHSTELHAALERSDAGGVDSEDEEESRDREAIAARL